MKTIRLTAELLRLGYGERGVVNRHQLAALGIPRCQWDGWRKRMIGVRVPKAAYIKYLSLRTEEDCFLPDPPDAEI